MWRRCLWRTGVWMGWRRLRWNRGGTLENVDLGKKMRWSVDGGAIGGGLSSDAPRLPGEVEGCRPGGAVGVPWGCHEAAADPHGCEPSPGKVESTRRARSIRSRGAFSSTSPAQMGISRDGIARGDDRAPFIGCYQGSVEGIGWMRGWNGAHLDRQRVAKSGDWKVASAISSNTKRRLPRRAALRRSLSPLGLETLSRIATSQEFGCLFMV